jgi:hypothetical protein
LVRAFFVSFVPFVAAFVDSVTGGGREVIATGGDRDGTDRDGTDHDGKELRREGITAGRITRDWDGRSHVE